MIAARVRQALSLEPSLRPSFARPIAETILRYGVMIGADIEHRRQAARCMDLVRAQILAADSVGHSFPSGRVIVADELTGGQGRFRRQWYAPAGGVWLVLAVANTLLPAHAALYSLAAGVACCEAVRHFGANATIKWVNDVLLNGRKVAGVLSESLRTPKGGEEFVLIGLGLNVNNTSFAPELRQSAAAMAEFVGQPLDLVEVLATLIAKLAWNIGLLHYVEAEALAAGRDPDDEAPHPLVEAWRGLSDTIGRQVRFGFNVAERIEYTARAVAIDNRGHLQLRLADGHLITEIGGEIVYV